MRCPNRGQLQELLDNALSEKRKRALETHLETCGRCRSELEIVRTSLAIIKEEMGILNPRSIPSNLFDLSKAARVERSRFSILPRIMRTSVQVPAVSLVLGAVAIAGLALSLFSTHRQLAKINSASIIQKSELRHETLYISSPTQYQAYQMDINLENYKPIKNPQVILFKEELQ
jgi:hypothetical protein